MTRELLFAQDDRLVGTRELQLLTRLLRREVEAAVPQEGLLDEQTVDVAKVSHQRVVDELEPRRRRLVAADVDDGSAQAEPLTCRSPAPLQYASRRGRRQAARGPDSLGAQGTRQRRLPMHAKFILLDGEAASRSAYGSLNLNARSRKVNREIFVLDESPEVFAALDQRWQSIERECRRQAERPKGDGLGSPQT